MNTIIVKETERTHRNLGFTEEVTSCDCCGRVDLKGTYAIEDLLNGGIIYLGCVCAAHQMNWSKKEFTTRYKAEEKEQSDAARKEYRYSAEMNNYNNWVNGLPDTATDEGWAKRMELLKSEGPVYKNALAVKMIELKAKYPLAKCIY
jgi:hypothetical protein